MTYLKKLGWVLLLLPSLFAFQEEAKESKQSLFWEISGNELTQPSYLFGTIHIIGEDDFFLPKITEEKFNECKVLATEVNLNMTMQEKIDMAVKTLLPNEETVEKYMTPEDYKELRRYMIDEVGIKEKKIDKYIRMKPFFLSSVIITEQLGKVKAYEDEFMEMAKKSKMEVMGLESIEYQFSIIDKVSYEDQVKMLMDGLKEEDGKDQFARMAEIYKAQQLDELYNMTIEESEYMPNFKEDFLDTRNSNWIPVIEESIKNNSVFIAVGAGHLAGETGVIELLRKQGYTVTALKD